MQYFRFANKVVFQSFPPLSPCTVKQRIIADNPFPFTPFMGGHVSSK